MNNPNLPKAPEPVANNLDAIFASGNRGANNQTVAPPGNPPPLQIPIGPGPPVPNGPNLEMEEDDSQEPDPQALLFFQQLHEHLLQRQQAGGMNPQGPPLLLHQLLIGLGNNGHMMQNHERIDVFDPAAADKLKDMKLPEHGLLPFEIDQIIPIEFKRENVKSNDPAKLECNICCEPFLNGQMTKSLQCLHTYHQKCINEWLGRKSICPDCRFNLRSLNMNQLV